ncbi:hypothetical protein [Clostridium beijerinckii]|uniref:hypothetical protein n=1 Tax=Clostridium beijerinckii TaxID=1520 RepID=UPI001570198E|nr:hypothetical protein [Clostridium beijerinckii]NRU52507.1 hypothetical protein [Clostridium beijerinckii]NYC69386.1 hypothetical protein [Clostridium beijerinckii]NYC91708.1 hypothetical protein [Clostridium beijerinckii]
MTNKLIRYFFNKSIINNKKGNIYMDVRNSVLKNINECNCLLEAFNKCKIELL